MANDKLHSRLSELERPELIDAATKVAGFDLGKRPTFGTAANVSGVRTRTHSFSRRRDSLTIFARDINYGHLKKAGAWTGPDRALVAACRRVLRAARVPSAEIGSIEVLSEHGTVAERQSGSEFRVEKPELLRKVGRAHRVVDGLPIWSSHLIVGLTRDGDVGQLELHWPRLHPEVIKEGKLLQSIVKRGFKAEEVAGARLESIEAGVLHSPAIGFFMDVTAAIRAVYVGKDPTRGRKPVFYLDRHGDRITPPRAIQPAKRVDAGRAAPR
jgi:hypothetical protein